MTPTSILCHGTQIVAVHIDGHIVCPLCGQTFPTNRPVTRKEGR